MLYFNLVCAIAFSAGALADSSQSSANSGAGGTGLILEQAAVQTGSSISGAGAVGSDPGQALSQTSTNNFINFCVGKTLTNGGQVVTGSCNGIVMGDIPAKTNMISTIITNPQSGQQIPSDTDFTITLQVNNLVAGAFTNADSTYYAAPQALQGGNVVGHSHVTIQDLGKDLNPQTPPDASQFAFFKGINDPGNGQGLLSANVTGGLPAGNYRVCTLTAAANHQPVLMPVAQRGAQDDCTKFTVTGSGTTINPAANNGAKGEAAAALASEAIVAATNSAFAASLLAAETATSLSAASSSTAAPNTSGGNTTGGGSKHSSKAQGHRHGRRDRKLRFTERQFIV